MKNGLRSLLTQSKKLISCMVLLLVASQSYAGLISVDWKASGDGLLTQDTSTGLYWLDLTETTGQSYNSVTTQLNAGNALAGFTRASSAEINTLYSNAGSAGTLMNRLGSTRSISNSYTCYSPIPFAVSCPDEVYSVGMTSQVIDFLGTPSVGIATVGIEIGGFSPTVFSSPIYVDCGTSCSGLIGFPQSLTVGSSTVGSWLYASTIPPIPSVPEPAILVLLMTGLIALGSRRRSLKA